MVKSTLKEHSSILDKVSKALIILVVLFVALTQLKSLLIPLVFAILVSIALLPLVQWLERKKFHRILAIITVLFILFISTVLVGLLLSLQLRSFATDFPNLLDKLETSLLNVISSLQDTFNLSQQDYVGLIRENSTELVRTSGKYVSSAFEATTGVLSFIGILPIYCFLLLYYREKFRRVVIDLLPEQQSRNASTILREIKMTIERYVLGLLTVVGIIAVLNTTGLLLLDIKYAIFLGILSALLSIIPYIGVFIGGLIPFLIALLTKDSIWYPIGVVAMYWFVQIVEGNFITPRVMGSQVNLNALAIIFGLLLGGYLWGIMGMVMAVPLLAVIKVICSKVDSLKAYEELLGNEKIS